MTLCTRVLAVCSLVFIGACASSKPIVNFGPKNPVIMLDRTACFGTCPAYTLTLRGDGTAVYDGKSNVEKIGHYTATISTESLTYLIKEFDRIKFFSLNDVYDDAVTDIPTYTLRYTLNDSTKKVTDRFGPPPGLRDLERTIDSVADQLSWKQSAE